MEYIVKINDNSSKDKLRKVGKITWESGMCKGLYSIISNFSLEEIEEKSFVEWVEIEQWGDLNV